MQRLITRIHSAASTSRRVPVALRYLLTVALVAVVVWFQLTWAERLAQHYPFLLLFPIILFCGAFFNRGNGFFATILSALAVSYFFLEPRHWIETFNPIDQIALVLFVLIGFAISCVVEALHTGLASLASKHESVTAAVRDRDVLLHELAHRTRNDLTNVVTLLNLQARSLSGDAREALVSAADRVQTIARVHRRLELRDANVFLDTKLYLEELCADLRLSRLGMRPIALECHAESHSMPVGKAVPIGLIINEAVTNAVKHAFPERRQGRISVGFTQEREVYKLVVADDGVGRKVESKEGTCPTPMSDQVGNRLMEMLAAQLGSKLEVEDRSPGTAIIVSCPMNESKK